MHRPICENCGADQAWGRPAHSSCSWCAERKTAGFASIGARIPLNSKLCRCRIRISGTDLHNNRVRLQLEDRIADWLSTIPIGGRESRRYDKGELVKFAMTNSLSTSSVDNIYAKYVESQLEAADETLYSEKFVLEVTSRSSAGLTKQRAIAGKDGDALLEEETDSSDEEGTTHFIYTS